MCCSHYRLISRTDPTLSLLPSPSLSLATTTSPPYPFSNTRFHTHTARIRIGYSRPRAAVNDAAVAPPPKLKEDVSFYELLGIPETVTVVEIKQAYKQLARKYHPDVSPPGRVDEYTRRFIRVQEAYETLLDPGRRALYDRDMAQGLHLAFSSSRNRYGYDEQTGHKSEWKNRWRSQLSELKRRSMYKNTSGNMSWGARIRRESNETST